MSGTGRGEMLEKPIATLTSLRQLKRILIRTWKGLSMTWLPHSIEENCLTGSMRCLHGLWPSQCVGRKSGGILASL